MIGDGGHRGDVSFSAQSIDLLAGLARPAPRLISIEARDFAQLGARIDALGDEVRLVPPSGVKACLKRGKNDATDAEALCEAVTRPSMRFVPVKRRAAPPPSLQWWTPTTYSLAGFPATSCRAQSQRGVEVSGITNASSRT